MSTVTLELGGNAKQVVDGINQTADAVDGLTKEMTELDEATKKTFKSTSDGAKAAGKAIDDNVNKQKKEVGIIQKIEDDLQKLKKTRKEANDTSSIKKLNKEIDEQEKKLNKLTGTTKKAGISFKEIAKGALAFTGITAGIGAVQAGFRRAISAVADYDQATSQLQAITGLDDDQFKSFDAAIKGVASNTKKSAVDVAKAFQLIGSAQPELLKSADALGKVTESAIVLSKAGGLEVPAAAEALTKAMNQFGASADDAAEFTDILAESQQAGTATISQLADSLTNVGAVANAAGVDFKNVNIDLQALAKGGLVGAEAGTALRGVYSKLANQSRDELNPTLNSTQDIIAVLAKENIGLKEATDLVGESSAKALLTLIAQEETIGTLTEEMNDLGDANDQANQATANVNDKWDEFNNTIDNAIIRFGSGESALSGFLTVIIDTATEIVNLVTGAAKLEGELSDSEKKVRSYAETFLFVVKTLGTLLAAYKAYQLALKIGSAIQLAINKATQAWTLIQQGLQAALKVARAAQIAFNAAAAANPIGLIIVVLAAAVAAFIAFGKGVDEAAISQEAFNNAVAKGNQLAKEQIKAINEVTQARVKAVKDEITLRKAAGENAAALDAEQAKREEAILKSGVKVQKKKQAQIARETKAEVDEINKRLAEVRKAEEENNKFKVTSVTTGGQAIQQVRAKQLEAERVALLKERATKKGFAVAAFNALKDNIKENEKQIKAAQFSQQLLVVEGETALTEAQKKAAEKRQKQAEADRKKLLALEKKFQQDLAKLASEAEKIQIDNKVGEEKFKAEEELRNREIDAIKKNLEDQKEVLGRGRDLTEEQLKQIQILRDQAQKERIDKTTKFNDEQLKAQQEAADKSLDQQEQIRIEEAKQFTDDSLSFEEIERAKQLRILEIQQEFAQKRIDQFGDNLSEEDKLLKLQLQNQANDIANQIDTLNKEAEDGGFSMAKLLGVTDEEFGEIKDALNVVGQEVLSATQDLFAEQQAANEELIDGINERIDETEDALATELELNEAGFASNVAGKQAELAALKAERAKAQKEQESLAKKQFALDTALQASALITSAANIIKATSSITPPFGQILAAIAVGAIAALFVSAKVKAYKAIGSGSQAATGASGRGKTGRVHGKRHAHGGENFTDHLEVEGGEDWGILSRGASSKHGDKFHAFTEGLNAGKRPQDMIDDLLDGTGVTLDKSVPKDISSKNITINQLSAERDAEMTSSKMVEIMSNLDGNLEDFLNFEKSKIQVIQTDFGRIEIEGNKKTRYFTKKENK